MQITVNGERVEIGGPMSVSELLVDRKVRMADQVSVEHNGEILTRTDFPSRQVNAGDTVEFLYFMGGGR